MPYIAGNSVSLLSLLIACGLGVAAGGVASVLLRKPWDSEVALIDAAVGLGCAVAIAYGVTILNRYGTAPYSPGDVVLPVALGSVVVRHLLRLAW